MTTRTRYGFTIAGWVGAALFVLPTPLAAWHIFSALQQSPGRAAWNDALARAQGFPVLPDFSLPLLIAYATAPLIGVVLMIIGREAVTTEVPDFRQGGDLRF